MARYRARVDSFVTWWTANWPGIYKWLTEGNAPDWGTGVVALFALIYAKKAATAAMETYRVQAKQVRDLEMDRRSQQAEQVEVWLSDMDKANFYEVRALGDFERLPPIPVASTHTVYDCVYWVEYRLQNASAGSVQDVTVYAQGDHDFLVAHHPHVTPADLNVNYSMGRSIIAGTGFTDPVRLGLLFVDTQRQHWDRRPTGELVPLTAEEGRRRLMELGHNSERVLKTIEWKRDEDRQKLFKATLVRPDP